MCISIYIYTHVCTHSGKLQAKWDLSELGALTKSRDDIMGGYWEILGLLFRIVQGVRTF